MRFDVQVAGNTDITCELEQVQQGIEALKFWRALASGHHRELQLFMGNNARAGVDMFYELGDLLHDVVIVMMTCSNSTIIEVFQELLYVLEGLTGGPCKENQRKLAGSVVVPELGRLLYNLESITSETMPNFVDEYHGKPPGTFEAGPGLTHMSPGPVSRSCSVSPQFVSDEVSSVKKSIYRMFVALLDGSDPSVAKSLLPHINTLCLLRDMFKVLIAPAVLVVLTTICRWNHIHLTSSIKCNCINPKHLPWHCR